MFNVALVGNPNCGKTTLQNLLTGSNYPTGNWSGVTVREQLGSFEYKNSAYQVVDLPGIYSLAMHGEESAVDTKIAYDFITKQHIDVIVNVVNAHNLQRHLYLSIQLLEMKVPMIVVVNMLDKTQLDSVELNITKLSQSLCCPVVPIYSSSLTSHEQVKEAIFQAVRSKDKIKANNYLDVPYANSIKEAIFDLTELLGKMHNKVANYHWQALSLLEGGNFSAIDCVDDQAMVSALLAKLRKKIVDQEGEDLDILLADARYNLVQNICAKCLVQQSFGYFNITKQLDRIVLNRWLGLPIFLLIMYSLFVLTIELGGGIQDYLTQVSEFYILTNLGKLLEYYSFSPYLVVFVTQGFGRGLITTISFMPVLGVLFFYMALLEQSGYMSRAVFVVDRLMRCFGLPGKAFVPMIIGFSCNVPAILATRTLEQRRDRILAIMISPFMSCGARLAIYAVFTAAFFPNHGVLVVFSLYLIGIVIGMLTGLILRKTFLLGNPDPLIMEIPHYAMPNLVHALRYAVWRMWNFVIRAGKVIVPLCVILGILQSFSFSGDLNDGSIDFPSILSVFGRSLTPLFHPLGITANNWPAVIGLLSGISAKEVVVGTLNSMYAQLGAVHVGSLIDQLGYEHQRIYGVMYKYFDGRVGAFSYLLFVLLYFPCFSTIAVMLKELNVRWALFSLCWTTGIAYGVAVIFYQFATILQHPLSSVLWLGTIIMVSCCIIYVGKLLYNSAKDN